jgi:response regulator of citrate/malate metabolism
MNTNEIKVLIVEDNLVYATQLEAWLKPHVGEIVRCVSSENGSFYVSKIQPDLIFLDNILPRINGIDVIELYKEKSPQSTLILMSSVFDLTEALEAIKRGADYVWDKKREGSAEIMTILNGSVHAEENGTSLWEFLKSQFQRFNKQGKKVISIVEDDEIFAYHMAWSIRKMTSAQEYDVICFRDLKSFYDFSSTQASTVVFLDFYLPDGTAEEAVACINEKMTHPDIIVFSSTMDFDRVIELNLTGVTEYIIKNENWSENLLETIRRLKLEA